MKKIISLILSVVMVFSVSVVGFSANSYAADKQAVATSSVSEATVTEAFQKVLGSVDLSNIKIPKSFDELGDMALKMLYNIADVLIDTIVGMINDVIPSVKFIDEANYTSEMFFPGMKDYLSSPAAGAKWSLGYGSASLQTGDELDGKHYVGGSLSFPKSKAATAIYDDQRVRCIAVDDGSGRGTLVFAVLDGFGISNTDVRAIRKELADFAKANNIVGINLSVLHQHSCVDTFGMNGDLLKMIFANPAMNVSNSLFGTDFKLLNGLNKSFMENLYKVTVDSIKTAVNTMTEGEMYYSDIDAAQYIRDKREPKVFDPDIHRFRFVPDNGAKETWLCNMAIHCVGNGAAGTAVTGDYPYYMEKEINAAGANFIEIQGAELAISSQYDPVDIPEDTSRIDSIQYYGRALGQLVVQSDAKETVVAPLLNYAMKEYNVPVTNKILEFAGRLGALTNTVINVEGEDYEIAVASELGYLEIGTDLAIAIIPGELEPAIAFGGYLSADESWTGKDFDYPCFKDIVDPQKKVLVFGLMNDQVGYILQDTDYSSILSGVNEEIVATGNRAGSTTINAFEELYNSIQK